MSKVAVERLTRSGNGGARQKVSKAIPTILDQREGLLQLFEWDFLGMRDGLRKKIKVRGTVTDFGQNLTQGEDFSLVCTVSKPPLGALNYFKNCVLEVRQTQYTEFVPPNSGGRLLVPIVWNLRTDWQKTLRMKAKVGISVDSPLEQIAILRVRFDFDVAGFFSSIYTGAVTAEADIMPD